MGDMLTRLTQRVRSTLDQISLGQKILIAMMAVALIFGGVFFTRWITAPTYAPLFSNLSTTDASAIVDELNSAGATYQLADGGQTIMVDKDKVYDLRLQMSSKGLPAGNTTGYALLDKQGITTSEFQQHIDYQRALESELAMTLEALDGVRTAVVHVALPKDDVFVADTSEPTASVLLDLDPGTTLSATQIQAVTHLVSSSVEGMSADQVTVTDNTGTVLSAAGDEFSTSAAGDAQTAMEQDYEDRLAANAQQILDRIVGPGQAVVRVRADLNFDAQETQTKTYTSDPKNPPISDSTTKETYNGAGTPVGGVLGPSNPTGTGSTTGSGSNYKKETTTRNNAVGQTVQTTKNAPGSVNRLTVSVVLDQNSPAATSTANIKRLVANAVGLDPTRGDAITVAAMTLDTSAAKQAAAELAAQRAAEKKAQQMSLIRSGVIGGIILLIVLIAWWRSRRRRKTGPEQARALSAEQASELDAIRAELAARQAAAQATTVTPDEVARRQKVRTEIATMISDSPDEVAAMLRGWLSEEKA